MSSAPARSTIAEYFRGFSVLRETRLEYWGLQTVNLMDMAAYFALTNIVIVLLQQSFKFNDIHAGYVWTYFSAVVTLTMFFTGALTDRFGVRRSLMISMAGNFIGRIGIMVAGLTPEDALRPYTSLLGFNQLAALFERFGADPGIGHRALLAVVSLTVLAPFLGMSATVYQAGNRRFTTRKSRGAGFNLWYLGMNIGAFLGGVVVDIVRLTLGWDNTHVVTFGAICSVVGFFLAIVLIRNEEQLYGPDEVPDPPAPPAARKSVFSSLAAVVREPIFWRFLFLVALIVGVRAIFIYLHVLYPMFWLRVIGPDAWIGSLQALNPILVVVGLVVLIPALGRFSVYGMLTYGAIISSTSLFVLAIPAYGQLAYLTSVISLLVLTVGEVIWSPRLQEYTAAIAPRGQEGVYYGLAALPWFVAKFVASALSGHMLKNYIPEFPPGEPILRDRLISGSIPFSQSPSMLFLILGIVTIAGPLIAIALRGFFTRGARFEQRN